MPRALRSRHRLRRLLPILLAAGLPLGCASKGGATGEAAAPPLPPRPIPQSLDVSKLDDSQKRMLGNLLAGEPSPCKPGQSLYDAARDVTCPRGKSGAAYVATLVGEGLTTEEIQKRYEAREVTPPVPVDTTGAPMEGDPSGTVWIAEFADFQCPHCARIQGEMAKVLADEPGKVRVYYMFFPLSSIHPMARAAARAAWAAQQQGKFWPYAHLLFENQDSLSPGLMDSLAGKLGLDMKKFQADEASPAAHAAVQKDVDEGTKLGIEATPTLFINGRKLTGYADASEIEGWIAEAEE